MNPANLNLLFGWILYLSVAATIATAVTAILFFTLGGRFGKINDTVSVLQMLLMLPVSVGLFLLIRHGGAGLALLATVVGAIGMLIAAILQALLVLEVFKYEQTIAAVLSAGGAIGLWLLLADILALNIHGSHLRPFCYPLAMDMLVKGQVPVDDIVTRTFPLEQFEKAFQLALASKDSSKVMLKP